ncbi:hypothetical protein D3C86_1919020 [compost metagenome]
MPVVGNRNQQLLAIFHKRNLNLNQKRAFHLEGAVKNRVLHQRLQNHRRNHAPLRMLLNLPIHLKTVRIPQLHQPYIVTQQFQLRRKRH